MTAARVAVEDTANRCLSPIGTAQRHYRLSTTVEHRGLAYRSVAVVTGLSRGTAYAYVADGDGVIVDWHVAAEVDTGGDTAALLALGYSQESGRKRETQPPAAG